MIFRILLNNDRGSFKWIFGLVGIIEDIEGYRKRTQHSYQSLKGPNDILAKLLYEQMLLGAAVLCL